jgi:hypothetical protein
VFRGEIMLKLEIDLKPETERRVRNLMDSYNNKELFFEYMINYQIEELRKGIVGTEIDLREYEEKYKIKSAEFYYRFLKREFEVSDDFIIWSGIYETQQDIRKQLKELES